MEKVLKILFVEDVKSDAELIFHEIKKNKISFSKEIVDNKIDYIEKLKIFDPDLIISDYSLPQFDGMQALQLRNEISPLTPFLLVTGSINEIVAVDCMKAGADDYILKDNLSRLGAAILNSIKKANLAKEKILAEEELRKSEYRLQRAQSIAHVGNWELDLSTKMIWTSDEAMKIYGVYDANQKFDLSKVQEIPLPEYRAILNEAMDRLLKYNEPYEAEFDIKRESDGAVRSVYSKAELVVQEDGSKVKVIGAIQDITDRKIAEKALSFNNLLLRTQQEASIDGILIVDENDKIVNFNSKFIEFAKIPREILESGQDMPVRRHVAEQTSHPEEFINKVKHLNESHEETYRDEVVFKDGRTYDRYSAPISGPDNKYYGRVWYFRNITEHKKYEDAINSERMVLRTLIDNLPDPIYVQDKECRKVIANKADVENIGMKTEAEVLGKTDLELFPGKIGERGYADDMKVLISGNPIFDLEEEFINRDGVKRWLLTTKIPILGKDGSVNGLVGIGHDITERKQNIEELIRAKDKAEESDRLKTAFLHNISHEIRTPMNAIVGFSALLAEPDTDLKMRNSYIDVIMQSSNHLLSIITDIVDISNIEADLAKVVKSATDVNSTLKSLVNQFLPKASEKKIRLEWETVLPDTDAMISTDRTKLTQILTNLISNALKFTDKGTIKVSFKRKDGLLEFAVSDTGIGIESQYFDKIFDRFYQVQNGASRLYEGTGLGLAISKAYVGILGGKIWLTSELGRGTTFYFTIPYEKALMQSKPVAEKNFPVSFMFAERKKILVAEDIESNFKLIKYFLAGSNTELIHAINGKEAVEKCLAESNIDLILMDIKMPVMDGYTAVKLIREKCGNIPIVAQTAYADDRQKAFECGCTGFISKPFDRKGLFKVLSEFLPV